MLPKIGSQKPLYSLLLFILVGVAIVISLRTALAHGSMQDPISRVYACYLENPETPDTVACQEAIAQGGTQPLYDWNEVNRPNAGGNHQAIIPDGQLCSAGREKYAAFDEPRTDWARTVLPDSGTYTFLFNAYVPHNQGYFELYVTRDGYDPTQPLQWSDLELFARIDEPPVIDGNYYMPAQLPEGKSGHHIVYAIWQRNDSQEAFYSCSDVWFGDSPTPTPTAAPACTAPAWNPATVYQTGDVVSHNNREWVAKWGNANAEPNSEGTANPWQIQGYCQPDGTLTPTPVATETPPGPTPTATNTPQAPTVTPTATTEPAGVCTVAYAIVDQWGNGFQANVTVTNNSNTAVSGWTLEWTHAAGQQVTSGWRATISQTDNAVTASNDASHWNGTIGANGGTVSFGFNGSHSGSVTVPATFVLNGTTCNEGEATPTATATTAPPTPTNTPQGPTATATTVPPTPTNTPPAPTPTNTPTTGESCTVDYAIANDWGAGATVNVTVTNNSSSTINGWTLDWAFPGDQQITNLWSGSYSQTGASVSVSNVDYNANIPANGGTTGFGFNIAYSGSNSPPTDFTLNGAACQ